MFVHNIMLCLHYKLTVWKDETENIYFVIYTRTHSNAFLLDKT